MHLSITHTPVNTDRIRQLAHCAADGKWSEFYMSIPPRPDRDADLVLSAAADEIDRLRAEVAGLKDPAKVLANMMRGNIATPSPAALADLFGANLTGLDAANLRIAELSQALRKISEGNLGDRSWQGNYDAIRAIACNALGVGT